MFSQNVGGDGQDLMIERAHTFSEVTFGYELTLLDRETWFVSPLAVAKLLTNVRF